MNPINPLNTSRPDQLDRKFDESENTFYQRDRFNPVISTSSGPISAPITVSADSMSQPMNPAYFETVRNRLEPQALGAESSFMSESEDEQISLSNAMEVESFNFVPKVAHAKHSDSFTQVQHDTKPECTSEDKLKSTEHLLTVLGLPKTILLNAGQSVDAVTAIKNLYNALDSCVLGNPVEVINEGLFAKEGKSQSETFCVLSDPYNIMLHVQSVDDPAAFQVALKAEERLVSSNTIIPTFRDELLASLSWGGILNGLVGQPGGFTKDKYPADIKSVGMLKGNQQAPKVDFKLISSMATHIFFVMQEKRRAAKLEALQERIIDTLLPNQSDREKLSSVRKRIHEVVVENKNRKGRAYQPVVTASTRFSNHQHFYKCSGCGNKDQSKFIKDKKSGDVVCTEDGVVADESSIHTGEQYRNFEGEKTRNHHGAPANKLMSEQYNLSTNLQLSDRSGLHNPSFSSREVRLYKLTANRIESEISNYGMDSKETSVHYMDRQKLSAFRTMEHIGHTLQMHEGTIERAKEYYAVMRDSRSLLRDEEAVIAASLLEALEEHQGSSNNHVENKKLPIEQKPIYSARALKRMALHSSAIGKISEKKSNQSESNAQSLKETVQINVQNKIKDLPLAKWTLHDCRDWLVHTSQNMATQLAGKASRQPGDQHTQNADILEPELISQAFILAEYLEDRMQNHHLTQQPGNLTPGKLLLLLNKKEISEVIKDQNSGAAFHRAIRGLASIQRAQTNTSGVNRFLRYRVNKRALSGT